MFANGSVNLVGINTQLVVVPPKAGVPAVDVTGSYSVQAWVTLSNVGGFQTVVSGEGFNIASFFLQKRVDLGGAWFFTTQAGDSISSANCISPPIAPVPMAVPRRTRSSPSSTRCITWSPRVTAPAVRRSST